MFLHPLVPRASLSFCIKCPTSHSSLLLQVTVQVTASPEAGAAAVAGAEVTLYGVDMSFLSLLPYDLPTPQLDMVVQLAADVTLYGTSAYRLAPGAVRAVFDTLMRRRVRASLPTDGPAHMATHCPARCAAGEAYLRNFGSA